MFIHGKAHDAVHEPYAEMCHRPFNMVATKLINASAGARNAGRHGMTRAVCGNLAVLINPAALKPRPIRGRT